MDLKISEILSTRLNEPVPTREKEINDDFSFTLKKLDEEGLTTRLTKLIHDITVQGKKISEHMDLRDMKKYRTLITDFINEIVTNSHKFSRENFLDRRGRHRVYGIVKKVNENLDELAQELLKKEKDNIRILEKTDDIRGLLLDIAI
jgi:uncharacterized protein YaaR (DUF327 family)